jgi:sulfite exporter TauE/SafE
MSIRDDSIKEELKAQYEFLRIYSIFLIGLVSAVVGMILNETYSKSQAHMVLFIMGIISLIFVLVYFLVLTVQIRQLLKQLKK